MTGQEFFRSAPKFCRLTSERIVPPQETLARASRIAAEKGVTRVSDITGLDRLGIPVYSAVVPRSDDGISVYNGKGPSQIESRTGALMEAIERQTVLYSNVSICRGSYNQLKSDLVPALDPESFHQKVCDDYDANRAYSWIEGHDLLSSAQVLVPAGLAGYGSKYAGRLSPYGTYSTNGLASGNCQEEAVCHAFCELIERDAWTFAELRSQWIPWAKREALLGIEAAREGSDDADACPLIDLSGAGDPIEELVRKFQQAGLCPIVRDITSEFGIPCVIASAADDSVPGFPQAHSGLGAHPNARIAVVRALGELAQSRVVDIQGVREDLMPAGVPVAAHSAHTQRVQKIQTQRWMLQRRGVKRRFCDLLSTENDDIADDIRLILSRLQEHGIERAIVVDFTEPGGFAVVRVIVPGFELWSVDHEKIGARAIEFWRRNV